MVVLIIFRRVGVGGVGRVGGIIVSGVGEPERMPYFVGQRIPGIVIGLRIRSVVAFVAADPDGAFQVVLRTFIGGVIASAGRLIKPNFISALLASVPLTSVKVILATSDQDCNESLVWACWAAVSCADPGLSLSVYTGKE